jgi:hypothetical protein
MYKEKKPRDYRSLWLVSLLVLLIGIILTISLTLIRPLGFSLLAVGGVGMVLSLANMDKWNDKKGKDNTRHFN